MLSFLADYVLESKNPHEELKWMESVGHLDTIEELQLSPRLLPHVMSFFERFQQFQTTPGNWGFCVKVIEPTLS